MPKISIILFQFAKSSMSSLSCLCGLRLLNRKGKKNTSICPEINLSQLRRILSEENHYLKFLCLALSYKGNLDKLCRLEIKILGG